MKPKPSTFSLTSSSSHPSPPTEPARGMRSLDRTHSPSSPGLPECSQEAGEGAEEVVTMADAASAVQGRARVVGDYILGPRIGSGSFAVVWRARNRVHGYEVAVKEIDKKRVDSRVRDGLLKEISILRHISHPNIVRFYEAIQTEDKIYLVLEYCSGGDVAVYIKRHGDHGRLSESIARHFMRQLAEGLKVLRENNLIHRDLKPQNLLLSTSNGTAVLKIGDFGFARYLTPQGLADTVCGSPLYMAPEIIQDRKYDAKADLWSVGAILYQLVTGKLPFDGNTHYQLFQNIMASEELKFPQDVLGNLHPDCINLCRSLLRQNPVERLAFEEFFSHNFMAMPRTTVIHNKSEDTLDADSGEAGPSYSSHVNTLKSARMEECTSRNSLRVTDSLELIEREYVIVPSNFASLETLSSSLEPSFCDNSTTQIPSYQIKMLDKEYVDLVQPKRLAGYCMHAATTMGSHLSSFPSVSKASASGSKEIIHKRSSVHPSFRFQCLKQYINAFMELAQKKLSAGLFLESFSIELIILAVWRETLQLCHIWMTSRNNGDSLHGLSADHQSHKREHIFGDISEEVDFTKPLLVCSWAESGFLIAYDRAEALSNSFQDTGDTEMPDAMEVIFQSALTVGKIGAVEELMGHWNKAVASYSKAITCLTFIMVEAMTLPLSPPFLLSHQNQQRLGRYISNLKAHLRKSQMAEIASVLNH